MIKVKRKRKQKRMSHIVHVGYEFKLSDEFVLFVKQKLNEKNVSSDRIPGEDTKFPDSVYTCVIFYRDRKFPSEPDENVQGRMVHFYEKAMRSTELADQEDANNRPSHSSSRVSDTRIYISQIYVLPYTPTRKNPVGQSIVVAVGHVNGVGYYIRITGDGVPITIKKDCNNGKYGKAIECSPKFCFPVLPKMTKGTKTRW